MNLEPLKGQTLIFLGKSAMFSDTEIRNFLVTHGIEFARSYNGERYVVEHRLLNPLEEEFSNQAYEAGATFYKMEAFEKTMSASLEPHLVLMALKLNQDGERIYRMLGNEYIDDALFIKVLNLYRWEEESFGDGVRDRDVLTFTLKRFLKLKPNETDLYFSPLSLHKLAKESQNQELLLALINFPNVSFLQKDKSKITLKEAIAQSPHIDRKITKKLLSFQDPAIEFFIAANAAVELDFLKALLGKSKAINQALASNTAIDDELFGKLLEEYTILAKYQPITKERYRLIKELDNASIILATNPKLDQEIVAILLDLEDETVYSNLLQNPLLDAKEIAMLFELNRSSLYPTIAKNPKTPLEIIQKLFGLNDNKINMALALNPSTPQEILEALFAQNSFEIHQSLATNPSAPLEILNILKIDTRLRNELTRNQTFTDSIIKSQGLYW
ncbi:MAG: hypothetical protein JXQ76_11440 [Campylobacterales bacterium]|nr:hypothetical protein [Campylobacterales bacterium]